MSMTEIFKMSAEYFVKNFICVKKKSNNHLLIMNDLYWDAIDIKDGTDDFLNYGKEDIVMVSIEKYFLTEALNQGMVKITTFAIMNYEMRDEDLKKYIPEDEVNALKSLNIPEPVECVYTYAEDNSSFFPTWQWKLKTPIQLKDTADLLNWFDQGDPCWSARGVMELVTKDGEKFCVVSERFKGWLYTFERLIDSCTDSESLDQMLEAIKQEHQKIQSISGLAGQW